MMSARVELSADHQLALRNVVLLYTSMGMSGGTRQFDLSGSAYAIAATAHVAEGGAVEIGAYSPVTMEFVAELAKGLGVDLPREVLPRNVLCRTQDVICWWTPAGKRTLFFGDGCKLEDLSGEDFPVPALVWRLELKDHRLFLRALAEDQRPDAGTKLYVAPFLNVYPQGLVCQGTMRRPNRSALSTLEEWEHGFFGASGSSQLTAKATAHRGQLWGLWRGLRRRKEFLARHLLEAGQTLTQFLAGGEH
jgi:PRTRC genetic system protein B